ncbi:THAP domain-containing protein 4 [Ditylenchus destructor]|nr:THAP domain-containing protein 4 [Ditylenchus destructor]
MTDAQDISDRKWFKMSMIVRLAYLLFIFASICLDIAETQNEECRDLDLNCPDWISADKALCGSTDYIVKSCRRTCGVCKYMPRKFDISRIPSNLQPIAFLVGIWRSDHGGTAIFPTIPKFRYGEEVQFSLSDPHMGSSKALNYTAFAWGHNQGNQELHSENGYITVREGTTRASLTTVMNNGFVTVEEGPVSSNRIRFRLVDIGRISFSRDLPVHDLVREWTLIDSRTLEARLDMETLTHGMQEHTVITYNKIFP